MNYQESIDFLYAKLPMFTRVGAAALKKDLHNTVVMCEALGNPQHQFKSIHIAGTNGKGSTSHMLAAILQRAGYKTGLYTSPHLKDFRERIRINGKMIPKSTVTGFIKTQKELITDLSPSFFEVTVAMAFDYFAQQKVDIAIIEVGLGGRLDSTNVIMPELAVITNISLDHTNILGDSLKEIAAEKAGIIKKNTPVVIGEKQVEVVDVFIEKAKVENAEIRFAQTELKVKYQKLKGKQLLIDIYKNDELLFPKLRLDLTGSYQLKNVATVIEAVLVLKEKGYKIEDNSIYKALKSVKKLTGLQGRWQTIRNQPLTICDTGHNKAGIAEVIENIKHTPHHHLHMIIGMVKDKDIEGVLQLLPKNATYYFCAPNLERALLATELAQKASAFNLKGNIYNSVTAAYQKASKTAAPNDLVFVGGSTFVVSEIL